MTLASRIFHRRTQDHRLSLEGNCLIHHTGTSSHVEASTIYSHHYPFSHRCHQVNEPCFVDFLKTNGIGERRMLCACCKWRGGVRWPSSPWVLPSVQNTLLDFTLFCDFPYYWGDCVPPDTLTNFLSLFRDLHGRFVWNSNVLAKANIRFLDLKIRANFLLDYHFSFMCIYKLYGFYTFISKTIVLFSGIRLSESLYSIL